MTRTETNARLEALSDGVFAIAMTLLIIDIKLPATESLTTTSELWRALQRLAPSVFAFVLSFGIILITWVNHHATLRLVGSSSPSFIYANGFLLLTVVTMPFPTALLGAFLWTDHAVPAVVLYNAVLALQALGWILLGGAALASRLTIDERSAAAMRESRRNGYFAFVLYLTLAITGLWFPLAVVLVTAASWSFWLVLSIRLKHA